MATLRVTWFRTYSSTYFSLVLCLRWGTLLVSRHWQVGCHQMLPLGHPIALLSSMNSSRTSVFSSPFYTSHRHAGIVLLFLWGIRDREAAQVPPSHHMHSHCFSRSSRSLRAQPGTHDTCPTAALTLSFHDVAYHLPGSQPVVQATGPRSLGPTDPILKLFPLQFSLFLPSQGNILSSLTVGKLSHHIFS